ncbi:MAG: UPF0182 family protein, partial [Armatimonadota bacterium]
VSWMCARCDGDNYGEIVLYRFPQDKNVLGPDQVIARINQDTYISQQITLWNKEGSGLSTGNLMVVPVDNALLYVLPIYLESKSTKIPELKRVVVLLGNKIAMEETLDDAISAVIGERVTISRASADTVRFAAVSDIQFEDKKAEQKTTSEAVKPSGDSSRLAAKALEQFNKAQEAQKRGDWAEYGRQIDELKKTLNQLQETSR